MGRIVVFMALLSVAGTGCKRKGVEKNTPKASCRLKQADRSALEAIQKPELQPRAQRLKLLQRIRRSCKLPRVVRRLLELPNPDYPASFKPFRTPDDLRPGGLRTDYTSGHLMWWTGRACPFVTKDSYGSLSPQARAKGVFQSCIQKTKLLSFAEYRQRQGAGLIALMLYQVLSREGLPKPMARKVARAWMGPSPFGELARLGVRVPPTASRTRAHLGRTLLLTRGRVSLRWTSRKASWIALSGLEAGLRSDPGFRKPGPPISLFADARVPFTDLHQTLRAIDRASGRPQLVQLLGHSEYEQVSAVLVHSVDRPPKAAPPAKPTPTYNHSLGLTLVVNKRDFELRSRHGSECPEGMDEKQRYCFRAPVSAGLLSEAPLRELQLHLWFLFATKYWSCRHQGVPKPCISARHTLHIAARPSLPYADLVRILDTTREGPRRGKHHLNPPRDRLPWAGCQGTWDKKRAKFVFPEADKARESRCVHRRVVLSPK